MRTYMTFFLFSMISSQSLTQWELRNNGISALGNAWAMDALDSNNAVVSYIDLYKTTNAGLIWTPVPIPSEGGGPTDVEMIDPQIILYCTEAGMIYKTTNGGVTWQQKFSDTNLTKFINYIEMFDPQNGMAMGDPLNSSLPTLFLKTTDSGDTWASVNNSAIGASGDIWRRIDFVNQNTGYFFESGINPQKLYRTTNGASSWIEAAKPASVLAVIKFFNGSTGMTSSPSGQSYRTADSGMTWQQAFLFPAWPEDIEYFYNDASKVWIICGNQLFFSSDSGKTFHLQLQENNIQYFRDIKCTDNKTAWLLGNDGYVFITTNADAIIGTNEPVGKINTYKLYQNYPNPFNPSTKILFSIPEGAYVNISVTNILGEIKLTMINEYRDKGIHEITFDGSAFSPGVYFYTLNAGKYSETKKFVLLK